MTERPLHPYIRQMNPWLSTRRRSHRLLWAALLAVGVAMMVMR